MREAELASHTVVRQPDNLALIRGRRVAAILFLAALVPYAGSLFFGFIYDDTAIVRSNPLIRGWGAFAHLWSQPYWTNGGVDQSGLYRPVLIAVFALIWNAIGHVPFWFHLFVVLLHATVVLLVWQLLRRGVSDVVAAVAAAFFAVHPVHVEAVANIANSSEVMVAAWTIALALVAARMDAKPGPIGWRSSLLLSTVFAAACLTKESGFVAPGLAMCWLYGWRDARGRSFSVEISKWWRAVLSLAATFGVVIVVRILVLGGPISAGTIAAPGLDDLTSGERMWAMLSLGPTIASLLVWPARLNPGYSPSVIAGRTGPTLAAAITVVSVVSLLAWTVWRARSRSPDRRPLAALLWTLIAFIPASNMLAATGQILAERTLYVSSIGIAMVAALMVETLLSKATALTRLGRRAATLTVILTSVVIVAAASGRTWKFVQVWRGHAPLFQQMIAADSLGYRGYWLLGMYERNNGRPESALTYLARAFDAYPRDRQLLIDYSELLAGRDPARSAAVASGLMEWPELRKRPEAVALYLNQLGRAFGPDSVIAAGNRIFARTPSAITALFIGAGYEAKSDRAAAAAAYRAGLEIAPADSALRARLLAVK